MISSVRRSVPIASESKRAAEISSWRKNPPTFKTLFFKVFWGGEGSGGISANLRNLQKNNP